MTAPTLRRLVVVELRTANPLLPMRVVLDRNRGGTFIASLLVGAGLFAMFLFLTYFLQYNLGYSALKSGFAFLPFSAGIIVTAAVTPVRPHNSTIQPRPESPRPMALSMPCTGKGV